METNNPLETIIKLRKAAFGTLQIIVKSDMEENPMSDVYVPINKNIQRLIDERKRIAHTYFETNDSEIQQTCINLFINVNKNLINYIGL